eukprot:TRINITY_DN1234_c0_g1_i1.p1 TRINITY_DN1234_c0_g1~~TRINITY_DN1234_c0_g1_i1.p1  ORF type:complete len:459 (+),score=142.20 TRINITY_DN1234_c0_g1_i1:243-1619(+)
MSGPKTTISCFEKHRKASDPIERTFYSKLAVALKHFGQKTRVPAGVDIYQIYQKLTKYGPMENFSDNHFVKVAEEMELPFATVKYVQLMYLRPYWTLSPQLWITKKSRSSKFAKKQIKPEKDLSPFKKVILAIENGTEKDILGGFNQILSNPLELRNSLNSEEELIELVKSLSKLMRGCTEKLIGNGKLNINEAIVDELYDIQEECNMLNFGGEHLDSKVEDDPNMELPTSSRGRMSVRRNQSSLFGRIFAHKLNIAKLRSLKTKEQEMAELEEKHALKLAEERAQKAIEDRRLAKRERRRKRKVLTRRQLRKKAKDEMEEALGIEESKEQDQQDDDNDEADDADEDTDAVDEDDDESDMDIDNNNNDDGDDGKEKSEYDKAKEAIEKKTVNSVLQVPYQNPSSFHSFTLPPSDFSLTSNEITRSLFLTLRSLITPKQGKEHSHFNEVGRELMELFAS